MFMVYEDSQGRIQNAWFAGPTDLVRWLKVFGVPLGCVVKILVLREE